MKKRASTEFFAFNALAKRTCVSVFMWGFGYFTKNNEAKNRPTYLAHEVNLSLFSHSIEFQPRNCHFKEFKLSITNWAAFNPRRESFMKVISEVNKKVETLRFLEKNCWCFVLLLKIWKVLATIVKFWYFCKFF